MTQMPQGGPPQAPSDPFTGQPLPQQPMPEAPVQAPAAPPPAAPAPPPQSSALGDATGWIRDVIRQELQPILPMLQGPAGPPGDQGPQGLAAVIPTLTPAASAEDGTTTSEFTLTKGATTITLGGAVAAAVDVAISLGLPASDRGIMTTLLYVILGLAVALHVGVAGYSISRGIRKRGTQG